MKLKLDTIIKSIPAAWLALFNNVTILIFVPFFDRLMYPGLAKLGIKVPYVVRMMIGKYLAYSFLLPHHISISSSNAVNFGMLRPVYMGKITSLARPWAGRWSKFQALFIWEFHAGSERRGKSVDVINRQRIIDFPLLWVRIYFTSPVVLRLYGETSLHLGETSPPEKRNFTIPVVWSEVLFSI